MKVTEYEAREIIWECNQDWTPVSGHEITDHSRWSVGYSRVFRHAPTGKCYRFDWSEGATEQQDEQPFDSFGDVEPVEVEEKEVTRKEWVAV